MTGDTTTLTVGDMVLWRGGFGSKPAERVRVLRIEKECAGGKTGTEVQSVPWTEVHAGNGRNVVVDLEGGYWAHGHQLKPAAG